MTAYCETRQPLLPSSAISLDARQKKNTEDAEMVSCAAPQVARPDRNVSSAPAWFPQGHNKFKTVFQAVLKTPSQDLVTSISEHSLSSPHLSRHLHIQKSFSLCLAPPPHSIDFLWWVGKAVEGQGYSLLDVGGSSLFKGYLQNLKPCSSVACGVSKPERFWF